MVADAFVAAGFGTTVRHSGYDGAPLLRVASEDGVDLVSDRLETQSEFLIHGRLAVERQQELFESIVAVLRQTTAAWKAELYDEANVEIARAADNWPPPSAESPGAGAS